MVLFILSNFFFLIFSFSLSFLFQLFFLFLFLLFSSFFFFTHTSSNVLSLPMLPFHILHQDLFLTTGPFRVLLCVLSLAISFLHKSYSFYIVKIISSFSFYNQIYETHPYLIFFSLNLWLPLIERP